MKVFVRGKTAKGSKNQPSEARASGASQGRSKSLLRWPNRWGISRWTFGRRGAYFLVVPFLIVATSSFFNPNIFKISQFEVTLAPTVDVGSPVSKTSTSRDLIFAGLQREWLVRLGEYQGAWVWTFPLAKIFAAFSQDPRVETIDIQRSLAGKVAVNVQVVNPRYGVLEKDGLSLVTDQGVLLASVPLQEAPDVPIFTGPELRENPQRRREVIAHLQELPDLGPFSRRGISEITIEKDKGLVVFLSHPKHEIWLGNESIKGKVENIEQVLNYLSGHVIDGRVIDARLKKKVVVRVRSGI